MSESGSMERNRSSDGAVAPVVPAAEEERPRRHRRRLRGAASAILVVFAVLFAILTSVAMWSHELLLNTDTFVKTVAPVLKDSEVTRATGDIVADATIKVTGLKGRPDAVDDDAARPSTHLMSRRSGQSWPAPRQIC